MGRRRTQPVPRPGFTLTDEVIQQIAGLVQTGVSLTGAAAYAGVPASMFQQWCLKGRRFPETHPMEAKMLAEVDAALGRLEATAILGVRQQGDWKWILERRFPDRYGKRVYQDVQVTATSDDPRIVALHAAGFEGDPGLLDDDDLETLITLMHKAIPVDRRPVLGGGQPLIEGGSNGTGEDAPGASRAA